MVPESGRHGGVSEQDWSHAPGRRAGMGLGWGSLELKLIENSWGKDPPHNPEIPGAWKRALKHGGTASHLLQKGEGVG